MLSVLKRHTNSNCKYISLDPTFSCCLIAGDPHIHTFDGAWIHFQGSCRYLLAGPPETETDLFKVTGKFGPRNGNRLVTWLKSTELIIGEKTIEIRKRNITVSFF